MTPEIVQRTFHQFLSPHNVERLASFAKIEPGWDGPKAKAMNEKSVLGMLKYLQQMREKGYQWREFPDQRPAYHECSTFMGADGNVELNWYNENWVLVHLTFINESEVEIFLSRPDIKDQEYTTKIDADNVPYYTIKADTVLKSQTEAMQGI